MVNVSALKHFFSFSTNHHSRSTTHTLFYTLLSALFVIVLCASPAEAATKKNCKNYISKQSYKSCMSGGKSSKTASLRKKQHVVYTRPQPATRLAEPEEAAI